ncbi:MAG: hypothetical protein K0R21_892 [Anaerocolumna sp.]|jgi:hypothetical protein|nr:hypothetical protein [Anaerocolumna sp.]
MVYKGENMSGVNGISSIDNKNTNYNINTSNKTTSKTSFSSFLGETKSLDAIFEQAAKEYNVPVNLLKAIGKAESNFDPNAVSRCGAQGVMQLMPATAAELGVTDSFDAEQNIMGGAKYISQLLKKYDGNTSLALAAYNAGSGNVAKYGGIPPFEETQNYVKKVSAYMNQEVTAGNITTTGNSTTTGAASVAPSVTTRSTLPSYHIINKEDKESYLQELDHLFSYEDYLAFLEKFLDESTNLIKEEDNNLLASKSILYNGAVMSLFK